MLLCEICQCKLKTIFLYNKHQFYHKDLHNLQIPCAYAGCNKKFKSYKTFRIHNYRQHFRVNGTVIYSCTVFNCHFKSTIFQTFNKHVRTHFKNSTDGIKCPFAACCMSNLIFHTEGSYVVHVQRRHCEGDETYEEGALSEEVTSDNRMNIEVDEEKPFHVDKEHKEASVLIQASGADIPEATKSLVELCLLLTTKHHTTEPALQLTVQKISQVLRNCQEDFFFALNSCNLDESKKQSVIEAFHKSFSGTTDAFHEKKGFLRNTYNRRLFYRKNLNIILPIQVPLMDVDGVESGCYYSYVPILHTLSLMLENKFIQENFENRTTSDNPNVLFDIKDGTVVKNCLQQFMMTEENILQIILFQDAFEVCNPLGSAKKKFKIVAVYLMLGNVPPHLRTKKDNIKLVSLCLEKYVTTFGWEKVLGEVIKDLKHLETNGITISVKGQCKNFKGTLIAMLGDSLGSHQIGGYTENFSRSHHFCRYCEIHRDEFRNNLFATRKWRTQGSYRTCVRNAEETRTIVKGIKKDSALNSLNYYHVANPGLPPCLDHDVFEGFVQSDMWLAIRYFVAKKWFRENLLNFRLNDIQLLTEGKLYIPPIKVTGVNIKKKLVGTASQMRRLVLILPVAIADVIRDFDDPVWQMVLHLRTICSFICAPAISIGQIASLKTQIDGYLHLRSQCFPNVPMIPKHEFLFHYPNLTLMFGPLRHCSTLHCECKHGYFKTQVKHFRNFKNITQTLAEKHQLKEATLSFREDKFVQTDNAALYIAEEHNAATKSAVMKCFIHDEIKFISEKVIFRGIKYTKDMNVCVGLKNVSTYEICTLKYIVINSSHTEISFVGSKKEIIYNPYVGVFENYDELYDECERVHAYPFSSLLSPDPIPQMKIGCVPIYLPKYAPYDPEI